MRVLSHLAMLVITLSAGGAEALVSLSFSVSATSRTTFFFVPRSVGRSSLCRRRNQSKWDKGALIPRSFTTVHVRLAACDKGREGTTKEYEIITSWIHFSVLRVLFAWDFVFIFTRRPDYCI